MFKFAEPEYLYLFFLIPILIIFLWIAHKRKEKLINKFFNKKMHGIIMQERSLVKPAIKALIIIIATCFIILGLANPQIGAKLEEVKQVGIDVFIALDVSLSMNAEDIKPSRLEKAKHEISRLIQKLRGDRIGLIVFSGNAYVQFPLTTDYAAANLFLSAVDVSSVPQPGTNIADAISKAIKSFKNNEETKKAIVIITDGEDHEGKLDEIIKEANTKKIQLYAIGLGSPAGTPIPVYNNSGNKVGYKKDKRGNTVLTKLDELTLKKLAQEGNGKYYRGTNTNNELEEIYNDLAQIEKSEYGATKIVDYEDRFYYLIAIGIILLLIEFFISSKKTKSFEKLLTNKTTKQ